MSPLGRFFMSDGPPTEDRAVSTFLDYVALACIFGFVDALIASKWLISLGALAAALIFHIAGIKWPQIKLRVGERLAAIVGRVAGNYRYRVVVVLVIAALLASLTYRYLHRNTNRAIPGEPSAPYAEESPSAEHNLKGAHTAKVTDENDTPLRGAEIYFIRRNGVHSSRAVSDSAGVAEVMTLDEVVSVFCALDGFSGYYQKDYKPSTPLKIMLKKRPRGGSVIFADGTGSITGLSGSLNPILDTEARTYLYARNIAIDGGKTQPVTFVLNSPMTLEDLDEHRVEIKIVSIIHSSSLIDYRRLR
jgi:hypothetical protein